MNETAAMIARRGLACPWPIDDLLFVEGHVRESLAIDLAICGYYSRDPETRAAARRACERLALDRSASRESRDHARNVLFWHAPQLKILAPSWRAAQLEGFAAPTNWHAMNPSVARLGGRVMMNIRCVNYWIEPDGSYKFPHTEPAVMTRNFLVEVDPQAPHHVVGDAVEIVPDLGWMAWGDVRGMEDVRLFAVGGQLWFSAACRQMNKIGLCEQLLGRLGLDGSVHGLRPMRLNTGLYEKNWMPVVTQGAQDPIHFVYRVDPTIVVRPDMDALPEGKSTFVAADNFSGSSQLIPFDGGWLAMTHEPLSSPINGRRLNQQRFVWFDAELKLAKLSDRWIFELNEEIEYVVGLCHAPDGGRLIISYGSHDRQAWVGSLDADDVRRLLDQMEPQHAQLKPISEIATPPPGRFKPVTELLSSWSARRLSFEPPMNFAAHALSVINHKGKLLGALRCINYSPGEDSGYHRIADGAAMGGVVRPVSRTFLLEFDPTTLSDRSLDELVHPREMARCDATARGFEDMKLFGWGGDLWGIAAFSEHSIDGLPEQWLIRIDDDLTLTDARHVVPQGVPRRAEKNWMPIIGLPEPRFIYLCDPTTIVDAWGHVVSKGSSEIAAEHFHGGSQAVPFDGGWLAIVRWRQIIDETNPWVDFEYRNRFAWFDAEFHLRRLSPAWEFPIDPAIPSFPRRFQLAHGLCWHPDGKHFVVGYTLYEREPWVATVDVDDIYGVLGLREKSLPRSLDQTEDDWVLGQTNRALLGEADVQHAVQALHRLGLPRHINPPRKDWDSYLAIHHCLATTDKDAIVLDAGGAHGSSFLPALRMLGYTQLINLEINEVSPGAEDGIHYRRGDITASEFPASSVQFVLCQSVLEHDVNWRAFFREMARIMSPTGNLFVSVDYWDPPISSYMTIFAADDIAKMINYAVAFGFECLGTPNYECRDSWPWGGENYTFFNFLLKKKENASGDEPVSRHETPLGVWWLSERHGDVIARELAVGRRFEPEIIDESIRHISPGTDVLDLGANVGAMAIPFARATGGGMVHAFEAEPFIATILGRNVAENDVNVRVYNRAVWHTGDVDLTIAHPDYGSAGDWGWGNCEIDPTLNSGRHISSIAVDQLGLIDPISFMKVDVQGSDLFALQGARETIMRHRMPILFEFEPLAQGKFGTSWEDYERFIEDIGYSIVKVIYGANYLIMPR